MSANGNKDHRKTYWRIWAALMVMTAITVWISYHDFGTLNIVITMTVASVQAALVALFFMHLKYDNKVDAVIFILSFLFLGIFAGLTASDMLDRETTEPLRVAEIAGGGPDPGSMSGAGVGNVAKLAMASPELISQGKQLYAANCASCHGAEGRGDGPAAAAFTPKPRDFTSGEWKQGGKPSQIFNTLNSGMGSMPSFAALPPDQRWALVHYIRSLSPNRPEDSAADIAALSARAGKAPAQLPVRVAMALMAVPEPAPTSAIHKRLLPSDSEGARLYHDRCAACHGGDGQGGVRVRVLGSNPFSYLSTRSFTGSRAAWTGNLQEFIRINSEGLPGFGKPGISDLTPVQWQALYGYVQQLAGVR